MDFSLARKMLHQHFNNQCKMSYIIFDIKLCYKYLAISWMTCLFTTITFSPFLAKIVLFFSFLSIEKLHQQIMSWYFPLDLERTHKSNFRCPFLLYFFHSNLGCKPLQHIYILLLCKCKHKPFLVCEITNLL